MAHFCGSMLRRPLRGVSNWRGEPEGYLDAGAAGIFRRFAYINRETSDGMRKFIFSLSAGERIIASETISTMAVNFPDFFWPRFATAKDMPHN